MTKHTCNNEPDKHGRVVPDCDGCYDRVYAEGRHAGIGIALNKMDELLEARRQDTWSATLNQTNLTAKDLARVRDDLTADRHALDGLAVGIRSSIGAELGEIMDEEAKMMAEAAEAA